LPAKVRGSTAPLGGDETAGGDDAVQGSAAPSLAAGALKLRLQEYESRLIVETLLSTGWNQTEAAKRLGMPIRTLAYKIKAFGITRPAR
jgi:DNA-binding NtrC family response regulator